MGGGKGRVAGRRLVFRQVTCGTTRGHLRAARAQGDVSLELQGDQWCRDPNTTGLLGGGVSSAVKQRGPTPESREGPPPAPRCGPTPCSARPGVQTLLLLHSPPSWGASSALSGMFLFSQSTCKVGSNNPQNDCLWGFKTCPWTRSDSYHAVESEKPHPTLLPPPCATCPDPVSS